MPKGHPKHLTQINNLSTHLRARPGLHGYYVSYNGESVDGPFSSRADAVEAMSYYRQVWHGYYPVRELLGVRRERKEVP